MKNKLLSGIVLAAVALSPVVAVAQPGQRGGGQGVSRGNSSCFPGERASDCRQRRSVEQRNNHHYVLRNGRYEDQDASNTAVIGGILGFILGAAIAGSNSDRDYYNAHRNDRGWRTRCRSAYPGFDYRTGTYLGRDGYRHYCTR